MSLIHWWPLNGDTQDKIGNNNLQYTNNSGKIITNISGKLGGCYERTSTASSDLLRSTKPMKVFEEESICAWIYVSQHAALSTANGVVTNHDHNTNSGLGIGVYSTDGTNYYVSINAGNGSDRVHSTYWGQTNIKGAWHHVCLVSDGSKIRMYVDGKEDRAAVNYSVYSKADYLDIFNWSTGYYTQAQYRPACKVCDVRVYDHALSQAEVKELSKALAIYYSFNDTLAEPTTNLITGVNSLTRCTKYLDGVKVDWSTNSGDTYFFMGLSSPIVSGKTYTFSFECEGIGNATVSFGISNLLEYLMNLKDGINSLTFVANDTIASRFFFDDINRNTTSIFTITNLQLEEKDHATPYTPNTRGSMMVNEAGHVNPSSVVDFSLSTVSNNGTYSGYFDGQTTYIDTPTIKTDMFTTDYSLNFWVYPLDSGRAVYFGDYSTSNASNINFERNASGQLRYYHAGSPDKTFTGVTAPANAWTMLSITYTPGTMKAYKNGSLIETYTHTATLSKNLNSIMRIGRDSRTGSDSGATPFYGYMSEFRFYVTCLSEEDIQELYKSKAYITDKGDIETHEFIEGKTQAQVTSKYCFEADEFYEELYSGYDVLEYIESTGTQYVDTGYVTTSTDYTYELDMTPTKIGGFYSYMGFMASGTTPCAGIHEYSNVFMLGANATTNSSTTPVVNERVVLKGHFKSGAQKLYKNGTLIASNSTSFNHSTNTLSTHIFGRNYSSGRNLASIKLYSAKIYEGSTLVRHYIPVRRQSDNALGLYDILNDIFYTNSGSGTFISGPAFTNKYASIYENQHVGAREIIEN